MANMTAVQAREVLKLAAKRTRTLQQAKAAGLSEADVKDVVAEIDAEIAKIRGFAASQGEISTDRTSKK